MNARIEAWIEQQPDPALARACAALGEHLNGASAGLTRLLAPHCSYDSQYRPGVRRGRKAIGRYFQRWLDLPFQKSFAELGKEPINGAPCLLVYVRLSLFGRQGLGELRNYFTLRLDARGRIESIYALSSFPVPQSCEPSGLFPGLSPKYLSRERSYVGRWLGRAENLELRLFVSDELEEQHAPMHAVVDRVAGNLDLPTPRLVPFTVAERQPRACGILCHPTVVLSTKGRIVLMIEGWASPEGLQAAMAALFEPTLPFEAPSPIRACVPPPATGGELTAESERTDPPNSEPDGSTDPNPSNR